MYLRIFDLNDGFLRKKRFLNHENFFLPVKIYVPKSLDNLERFRDLSLDLAMTVILSTVVSVDISSLSALISIKCQVKYLVM